ELRRINPTSDHQDIGFDVSCGRPDRSKPSVPEIETGHRRRILNLRSVNRRPRQQYLGCADGIQVPFALGIKRTRDSARDNIAFERAEPRLVDYMDRVPP